METKKFFSTKSERVKALGVHPSKSLVACGLYDGQVTLWDYVHRCQKNTMTIGKKSPIRAVQFIEPTDQLICGADDGCCHVFHATTGEKVLSFQAHSDYVRCLAVSLTSGLVLTGGDDARISAWKCTGDWNRVTTIPGHSNYVMSLAICPYDPFLFCSASLDKTVKIWGIQADRLGFTVPSDPRCILQHPCGINCAIFHPKGGLSMPYVITGADDGKIRVWDFHNRSCVYTIAEHTSCVTCLSFVYASDKKAWLLLSGSEDEFVNTYDTALYQIARKEHHNGGRVWAIQTAASSPNAEGAESQCDMIITGTDRELNFEGPRQKTHTQVGVDIQHGRLVFSAQEKVFLCDLKHSQRINVEAFETDYPEASMEAKLLTKLDAPVTSIQFDESGQFIAFTTLTGYHIHSTLSWKHCASGRCHGDAQKPFAWGPRAGQFIILKNLRILELFDSFRSSGEVSVAHDVQNVFIGSCGAIFGVVHTDSGEHRGILSVFDWESRKRIKTVCFGTEIKDVIWNTDGSRCAIAGTRTFHMITWNPSNKGCADDPFSIVQEIDAESPTSSQWIDNDTLFYMNGYSRRVEYILYDTVHCALKGCYARQMSTSRVPLCMYSQKEEKVYFFEFPDETSPCDYRAWYADFPYDLVESYKRLRAGDKEHAADTIANSIHSTRSSLSDQNKFEAALGANSFRAALLIAHEIKDPVIWRRLGDISMKSGAYGIAIEAFAEAKEYEKLLVLCKITGNMEILRRIYESTCGVEDDVAFSAAHLASLFESAHRVLSEKDNAPLSALYAAQFCSHPTKQASADVRLETTFSDVPDETRVGETQTAMPPRQNDEASSSVESSAQSRKEEAFEEKTTVTAQGIQDLHLGDTNTTEEETIKESTNTLRAPDFSGDDQPLEEKQTELWEESVNPILNPNSGDEVLEISDDQISASSSLDKPDLIDSSTLAKEVYPHSPSQMNLSSSESADSFEENPSHDSDAGSAGEEYVAEEECFHENESPYIDQVEKDEPTHIASSGTVDIEPDSHSSAPMNQSSSEFDESWSHDSDAGPVEEEYLGEKECLHESGSTHIEQVGEDAFDATDDILADKVIVSGEVAPQQNFQTTSRGNSAKDSANSSPSGEDEYRCFIESDLEKLQSSAHTKYVEPEIKFEIENISPSEYSEMKSEKADSTTGETRGVVETVKSSSSSANGSDPEECTHAEQVTQKEKPQGESNFDEFHHDDDNSSFVFSDSEESGSDVLQEKFAIKEASWEDLFD